MMDINSKPEDFGQLDQNKTKPRIFNNPKQYNSGMLDFLNQLDRNINQTQIY